MKAQAILAFISAFVGIAFCNYLTEEPVKLLEVTSLATRFPSAASPYRSSINKGKDVQAQRTDVEKLNNFPAYKTILNPGGCANYIFPAKPNQKYIFVQPARKLINGVNNYCNKGKTAVSASTTSPQKSTSFQCFTDPKDCSPKICLGNIASILDATSKATQQVHLAVCNDKASAYDSAIWELNFSSSNDSTKIQAIFGEKARLRLRNTAMDPIANTQLTMVTLVGDRGVGKSTVSSLLSGNETMFHTGSSSTGTTTTGADISAVIPSLDYSTVISQKLNEKISKPTKSLPFFLIDSEGMNVRGKSFDFITTSPPAVVGKVIIWIGAENVQTAKILDNVGNYLDGLDQIILNVNDRGTTCKTPQFGHFAIVINKMMGNKTDQQLYQEIMTEEPDYIPGYEKRNEIRKKLRLCFTNLTVHGLPVLPVPSTKSISYTDLNGRFRDGLAKIASTIIDSTKVPRTITIGSMSLLMNSTNAERILATVIDEANKGKLDLTGYDALWDSVSTQVKIQLDIEKGRPDFVNSAHNCDATGKVCSPCVCAYRKKAVQTTVDRVNQIINDAKIQASKQFKIDATKDAQNLINTFVNPWRDALSCTGESKAPVSTQWNCDSGLFTGTMSTLNCKSLFICSLDFPYTSSGISWATDGIYLHDGATLNLLPPPGVAKGADATVPGQSGLNGNAGLKGTNLKISAKRFISYSLNSMSVIAKGGQGSNGGNGKAGNAGANGAPGANGVNGAAGSPGVRGGDNTAVPSNRDPHDANAVKALGHVISHRTANDHRECWCNANCGSEYYVYQAEWTDTCTGYQGGQGGRGKDGTPGGQGRPGSPGQAGGHGGNGGKGGDGGDVILGLKGMTINVQLVGGAGGQGGAGAVGGQGGAGGPGGKGGLGGPAGPGGPGGNGRSQHKRWTMNWNRRQGGHCSAWHCHCGGWGGFSASGYAAHIDPAVPCCQGQPGAVGSPGAGKPNGPPGAHGAPGSTGSPGTHGSPGTSKSIVVTGK